jgi:hypothetical protein
MTQTKFLTAALLIAAVVMMAPAANASCTTSTPCVNVVGAGSSAMWQTAAIGAYLQLAGGVGAGAQHYTIGGSGSPCNTLANCSQLNDQRSTSILKEGGNLWIVWDGQAANIWAYLSVDSVVGNRCYFAAPRCQVQIDPAVEITPGQNKISSALFEGTSDATSVPSGVFTALNNHVVTAAFTDIRPEDAKWASGRTLSSLNTTSYSGLGYGTGPNTLIGTSIQSSFSNPPATANPVNFALRGHDPFTNQGIPGYTTIDVGAAPIVFLINRTNSNGLGAGVSTNTPVFTNITVANAQKLFNGTECDGNIFGAAGSPPNFPVTVITREPLSGTMNTTESTVFRCEGSSTCAVTGLSARTNSQEKGVNPSQANNNPLNISCATVGGVTGSRKRGIGTSEVVKGASGNGGVQHISDSVGYAFFSFGNVSAIAGSSSYGYVTLNGIDPINSSYSNGQLPTCTAPCPANPVGSNLPNLRNGTYPSWSVLRAVTDSNGDLNETNTKLLVVAIQANVNGTVPDFVPFNPVGGDPGLQYYRSHYNQSGVTGSNGLQGTTESGGDMGGCVFPVGPPPGTLGCHQ